MAAPIARQPGKVLTEIPANAAVRLHNETCVYCAQPLGPESWTKEHVIGRRFVPKGKLDGQWNLIVRACRGCNQIKSDLEDDLSAITMQPDIFGRHGHDDADASAEAHRKARNSFSRRTKKPVDDSQEHLTIKMPLGPGAEITFNMTAPPQADSRRIFELARMQLMGFFYWITFNHSTKRGGYWTGGFYPVMEAQRSDWGNSVHRGFMHGVVGWEPRVLAIGADGFFKVIIRRHPSAECWSWALEWNQKLRIIGFFGNRAAAEAVVAGFPKLDLQTVAQGPAEFIRYRLETLLPEEEDKLFFWQEQGDKAEGAAPGVTPSEAAGEADSP